MYMYMYISVCVYVCMCMYVYMCIYTYIYALTLSFNIYCVALHLSSPQTEHLSLALKMKFLEKIHAFQT